MSSNFFNFFCLGAGKLSSSVNRRKRLIDKGLETVKQFFKKLPWVKKILHGL
jgi:hypothetical protein